MGHPINYLCQSAVQGSMILPIPGKPNQYYILGSRSYEFYSVSGRGVNENMVYAIVDMNDDGGLGAVTVKEQP